MTEYEDMSPWAVHFTRPREPVPFAGPAERGRVTRSELFAAVRALRDDGFFRVTSIFYDRFVRPTHDPHGAAGHIPELAERHRSACLSEIPLHLLGRLVETRSSYGLGFHQEYLLSKGGGRVWYLEDHGQSAAAVKAEVQRRWEAGVGGDDAFWRVTPFIDFPKPGEPWQDWRWEREWRVPGGLGFDFDDVAFIFLPERLHERARSFYEERARVGDGPALLCPYIDPTWTDRDRIAEKLREARAP